MPQTVSIRILQVRSKKCSKFRITFQGKPSLLATSGPAGGAWARLSPCLLGVCSPLGLATEREEEGTGQLFRLTGTCVVWHWASLTGLQVFKGPWPMRECIGGLFGTAHLRNGPTSPQDLSFPPSLWTPTSTLASVLWNKPLEMTPSRRLFLDKYI